jgi:predicted short-subunit dehydrogenase-like oxidoreductase (DUF2520 family)
MWQISIIGAGNVAWVFGERLKAKGHVIREVMNRDPKRGNTLASALGARYLTEQDRMDGKSDLYLIAVKDGAIAEAADLIPANESLVVHFSGSTSIQVIPQKNRAVLWPLRSIAKGSDMDWSSMNVIMESDSDLSAVKAMDLIQELGAKAVHLNHSKRKQAHLIAVILNNFSNHLLHIGDVLCEEQGLDRAIFKDLLTSALLPQGPAMERQTGPASRGDLEVIKKQEEMLASHPEFQSIYRSITASIIKSYEHEL